jgi:hypothetical protein
MTPGTRSRVRSRNASSRRASAARMNAAASAWARNRATRPASENRSRGNPAWRATPAWAPTPASSDALS